ncbi:MAG: hypothetical protein GX633_04820, partial [Clostridiales bacterium]|nr:hypothetical protein [Clostridiales bacterium]
IQTGIEGMYNTSYRYRYTIRWDYWEELGHPEFTDDDSFLEVVAQMYEKHPTNDAGDYPMYGVGFYIDSDSSTNWFEDLERGTTGHVAFADFFPRISYVDGEMFDNYGDTEKGPYWKTIYYYRKAWEMGLLDPESFSQTSEDWQLKFNRGQMLTANSANNGDGYAMEQMEKGINDYAGFVNIPVEGAASYQNVNSGAGWEVYFVAIPTSCKTPLERVMSLLNWSYSLDGARMLKSGAENVDWVYVDGVPQPTAERLNQWKTGEGWAELGIGFLYMITGYGNMSICSDGYPADLYKTDVAWALSDKRP